MLNPGDLRVKEGREGGVNLDVPEGQKGLGNLKKGVGDRGSSPFSVAQVGDGVGFRTWDRAIPVPLVEEFE